MAKMQKYGWYRYESRFALPIYDEDGDIVRYNIFYAIMLMRRAQDQKMYLYDIIQIKKEMRNLFWSTILLSRRTHLLHLLYDVTGSMSIIYSSKTMTIKAEGSRKDYLCIRRQKHYKNQITLTTEICTGFFLMKESGTFFLLLKIQWIPLTLQD